MYSIPRYIKKKKKEYPISSRTEKIRPPRHLDQLSISRGGLGILDIDTPLGLSKNKID